MKKYSWGKKSPKKAAQKVDGSGSIAIAQPTAPPPYHSTMASTSPSAFKDMLCNQAGSSESTSQEEHIENWIMHCELSVRLPYQVKDDAALLDILGVIVDEYSGPSILKPIVLTLYGISGANSEYLGKEGIMFKYGSELDSRISISVNPELYKNQSCDMNWAHPVGFGSNKGMISFKLIMKPSKRLGGRIFECYQLYAAKENRPSLQILKEMFMIDRLTISETHISFS